MNVTPELMQIIAAASWERGGEFVVDGSALVTDKRGLAYCAEYLRVYLGAMRKGPTAIIATGPATALAIISAAMPRLNEAWSDIPDQVLSVTRLGYINNASLVGPDLRGASEDVLLVGSVLSDGEDLLQASRIVRREHATIIGAFVLVDAEEAGTHERLQREGDIPSLYAVARKSQIVNYKNRKEMIG